MKMTVFWVIILLALLLGVIAVYRMIAAVRQMTDALSYSPNTSGEE